MIHFHTFKAVIAVIVTLKQIMGALKYSNLWVIYFYIKQPIHHAGLTVVKQGQNFALSHVPHI